MWNRAPPMDFKAVNQWPSPADYWTGLDNDGDVDVDPYIREEVRFFEDLSEQQRYIQDVEQEDIDSAYVLPKCKCAKVLTVPVCHHRSFHMFGVREDTEPWSVRLGSIPSDPLRVVYDVYLKKPLGENFGQTFCTRDDGIDSQSTKVSSFH